MSKVIKRDLGNVMLTPCHYFCCVIQTMTDITNDKINDDTSSDSTKHEVNLFQLWISCSIKDSTTVAIQ